MTVSGIRDFLWGAPTLILLIGFGAYFTLRLGFWRPTRIAEAFGLTFFGKNKKSGDGNLSSLSALATALGGTVGVGSINGVALSISLGGAGSIFWMWVCSFLGFGLKYAEVVLAHNHRKHTKHGFAGGAMYCLKDMGYKKTAFVFAFVCLISAFAGGSVVQAGAVSDIMKPLIRSDLMRAASIGFVTYIVIGGGRTRIAKFNTFALPLVSGLFIVASLGVIVSCGKYLPEVFRQIFGEAFGLRQAAGGISGAAMIRVGCVRGTFSHEAGMGSSPISYCASNEDDSHVQGLWGVTEVFIDSFVVSTLTALTLLCTKFSAPAEVFGFCYGKVGEFLYYPALGIFAFAAIISWCFYGEEALAYISKTEGGYKHLFRLLVVLGAMGGAMLKEESAFAIADILGVLMMFINLFLLYKSRSDIFALAKQKRG